MKRLIPLVGFTFLALALVGCVVSIDGKHPTRERRTDTIAVVPREAGDRVLMAEIDAVATLGLESSRFEALKGLAQRASLTPVAQVHLVNTSLNLLGLEASRFAILQTLIQNPSFTNAAKEAILTQIQKLGLESSRLAVLKAISERGALNH